MQKFFDRITKLRATIEERWAADPEVSYVAKMARKGRRKMAQKVGEEAVEVAIAAVSQDKEKLIGESSDVLFHLMVLWQDAGVTPDDIADEFARREGRSGLAEKKSRIM